MSNKFLNIERKGPILTVTMDHAETKNALTGNSAVAEFLEFCNEVEKDNSVQAIIITGANNIFSSGGNLKDMLKYFGDDKPDPETIRNEYKYGIQQLTRRLYKLDVPTIAAVNGAAIGAGLDLACMCDIRIASDKASFAESFVKVGLIPGDGGAWLLPRIIGKSRAFEMTLTGDRIDAQMALEYGLVSKVVSANELIEQANEIAKRITNNPHSVVRMTKRLLRESELASLDTVLEISAAYQAIAHQHKHHEEAVRAFIEKRKPKFE